MQTGSHSLAHQSTQACESQTLAFHAGWVISRGFLLRLELFCSLSAKNRTNERSTTIGLHPFLKRRVHTEFIAFCQFRLQLSCILLVLHQRKQIACPLMGVPNGERSLLSASKPSIKGIEREKCHQGKDRLLFPSCNKGSECLRKDLGWC